MNRPAAALLLWAAVAAGAVPATVPSGPLDLAAAVRLALSRNLDLARSANQEQSAAARVEARRGAFLPDLDLQAGPSLRYGRAFDTATGRLEDQDTRALSLSLGSSVTLFDGHRNRASLAEARLDLEAAHRQRRHAEGSVALGAASQFLTVFLERELAAAEASNLESARRQLEWIAAAEQAGNRPRSDVLQQRAEIAAAEQALLAAERAAEVALLRLGETLALDPAAQLELLAPEPAWLDPAPAERDTATLLARALAQRHDLAALRARIAAAEQALRVAKSGKSFTAALQASLATSYSSQNEATGFEDQLVDSNPNGSLGMSLRLPLLDRRQTATEVAQAEIALDDARLDLADLEQQVALGLKQALLDERTRFAQLAAAEAQLAAATEALAAAEARYEVGASTLLEVIEARDRRLQATSARLEARYQLALGRLAIAFESGGLAELFASLSVVLPGGPQG